MVVNLYAPETYREPKLETHIELLFPFWGVTAKSSSPYVRTASLQYQYSKDDFALVSNIEDADFVVLPYHYDRLKAVNPERIKIIREDAAKAKKPLLIDGSGDIEHPIDIPNSFVFRVSQYQYSKKDNEITIPFPAEDLLESYTNATLTTRKKTNIPSVSFMGWGRLSQKDRIKTLVKELPLTFGTIFDEKRGAEHKGVLFRERALQALQHTPGIDLHLKAHSSYSGHAKTASGSAGNLREAFVENLLSADYALCVRGDANASVRFYEALSLGRIPLFLDTASVLPLEGKINYRDFCVFVDWRDVDRIGERLKEFHTSISEEQFKAMQRRAREVYSEFLRTDSFSKHLAALLRERI